MDQLKIKTMVNQAKLLSDQVSKDEVTIILSYLSQAIDQVDGDIVEFGCYVGTTSVFLAKMAFNTSHKVYLYDSFSGLPDKTREDNSPLGLTFKPGELMTTKRALLNNLKQAGKISCPIIKKAWFNELTEADVPSKIMFAVLDGDYYKSIKDSFKLIEERLVRGAIIVVDDYSNESLPGAKQAVDEWLRRTGSQIN